MDTGSEAMDREIAFRRLLENARAELHEFKRMSLLQVIALVNAAGGKITVLPRDLIPAPEMELHTTPDPETGGVIYSTRRL